MRFMESEDSIDADILIMPSLEPFQLFQTIELTHL